jgi:hypothetical protein
MMSEAGGNVFMRDEEDSPSATCEFLINVISEYFTWDFLANKLPSPDQNSSPPNQPQSPTNVFGDHSETRTVVCTKWVL